MRELGEELRRCRRARGLSRGELAKLSGVSAQTIAHWEGPNPPERGQMPNVIKVARACGIPINDALRKAGFDPQPEPPNHVPAVMGMGDTRSREQLWAELTSMWPALDERVCALLVDVATIGSSVESPRLPSRVGKPQHDGDGHSGNRDGGHSTPPQYRRDVYGFRMAVIPRGLAAQYAAEDQQQRDSSSR